MQICFAHSVPTCSFLSCCPPPPLLRVPLNFHLCMRLLCTLSSRRGFRLRHRSREMFDASSRMGGWNCIARSIKTQFNFALQLSSNFHFRNYFPIIRSIPQISSSAIAVVASVTINSFISSASTLLQRLLKS